MRTIATGALLAVLGACNSIPRFEAQAAFVPELLERGEGHASVSGQAFLRASDGEVKFGAGREVVFLPETPWTREWYENVVIEGKQPTKPNYYDRLPDFARKTRADAEGRFRIDKLPAGRWIITCAITWQVQEYVDSVTTAFPPGFYYWHSSRRRRSLYRAAWPYPYYPWITPYERKVTVGGFAHAVVDLKDGEERKNVIVTR